MRPYLKKKKKSQKRVGGVAQGIGSEFRSQYYQKKKKILFAWASNCDLPE
jgi:hypothetical protein